MGPLGMYPVCPVLNPALHGSNTRAYTVSVLHFLTNVDISAYTSPGRICVNNALDMGLNVFRQ